MGITLINNTTAVALPKWLTKDVHDSLDIKSEFYKKLTEKSVMGIGHYSRCCRFKVEQLDH